MPHTDPPEASGDRFSLAGTTLAERYRVEHQIAEGGFAVVYRAYQLSLDRHVAIKVLKTPADLDEAARAEFRGRFAAEARTIAKLRHPYIVDVYDTGVSRMPSGEFAPWMALEWLDGETLEADLDRRRAGGAGGRSVAEAVALVRPLIEALAYAHRCGVIHRDIKPANVMVVDTQNGPLPRMLDFGIAKILHPGQDGRTQRIGNSGAPAFSPEYASPEQITFSRTGPFTDVHALGLLLTEVLTDQPPFAEGPGAHLFEQVMSPVRPTPRQRGRDVGRLERVIGKAVALSPAARWEDAGELLEALDAAMSMSMSMSAPASRRQVRGDKAAPIRAWSSKHAPETLVAGAGGLTILAAFALLFWTLGSGATPRLGPGEEMALASTNHAPVGGRVRRLAIGSAVTNPWIIPISSPEHPADAALLASCVPSAVPQRRSRATRACSMSINSVPWSEVWIDGASTGRHTPFVDYPIPCGRHRVEFKRQDLQIDQRESVVVEPNEPFKQRFTLAQEIE
ncbi:MAG TPA: serine/threonine-protein kinase [Polyangia bacterium]